MLQYSHYQTPNFVPLIYLLKMDIVVKFNQFGGIVPSINGNEITMNESPYLIFLATAGMCSAVYVRAFLQQRDMSLEGVSLTQQMKYNQQTNMVEGITILVNLPKSFPEKYNSAIKNVVAQCPVKKHFETPPTMEVITNLD
ncbi:MAG: OsmC family protein [Flavobacteriaceae bacterium]|nr:OsmC family protein [Flavobacteriaceae bacterium]